MQTKRAGIVKYLKTETAEAKDESGIKVARCMVRHSKISIIDSKNIITNEFNKKSYGANLNVEDGEKVEAGTILFQWDPYTDVILARKSGFVELKDFIENETFQVEAVEGGKKQMVIVESKTETCPHVEIVDKDGAILAGGTILPVTANLVVRAGDKVSRGQTLLVIPRAIGKSRDITGGLPRVTELLKQGNQLIQLLFLK